jgi:hypothetical protein
MAKVALMKRIEPEGEKRATKLKDLEFSELSLVDVPANQFAKVLIMKSEGKPGFGTPEEERKPGPVTEKWNLMTDDLMRTADYIFERHARGAAWKQLTESEKIAIRAEEAMEQRRKERESAERARQQAETLKTEIVKMFDGDNIETLSELIIKRNSGAMSADNFYELVRKAAQREWPNENPTKAAARLFTETSERGRSIRQAYDQLRLRG